VAAMSVRASGIISIDEAYTRSAFMRITGLTRSGLASACKNGLRTVKVGKRVHVLGRDWIDFLASSRASATDQTALTHS
jgi:hypothetical protein